MALTQDRDTKEKTGVSYTMGVSAGKLMYAGGIACINGSGTGFLTPGATALGLLALGRTLGQADNTLGSDGALNATVERGVFRYANSAGGDAIAETNIGEICFIVDDGAVALTNGNGTRSQAGVVFDVDTQGVWRPIDQRKVYVTLALADLISAHAAVYRVPSPIAGRITNLSTDLSAALATGDAIVTGKIGAVAITNGAVDIVQAGSAAGQINTAAPTAANAVAIGSDINFTIGGTNTGAAAATLIIEITR